MHPFWRFLCHRLPGSRRAHASADGSVVVQYQWDSNFRENQRAQSSIEIIQPSFTDMHLIQGGVPRVFHTRARHVGIPVQLS